MCCKKRKIGHELRTLDNMMSRNLMAAARERGVDELTAMHGWILGYLCRNEDKDIFQKDPGLRPSYAAPAILQIFEIR